MSVVQLRPLAAGIVLLLVPPVDEAQPATTLSIRIENRAYQAGERVFATLEAAGSVTLENDFKAASQNIAVNGLKKVELGTIPGPGLYVVRASDGQQKASAVLFVAPAAKPDTYELTASAGPVKPPAVSDALMAKFVKGMTRERVVASAKLAVKGWLRDNAAALGTTTTLCLVCFAPGGQFACSACASSGSANTIDLGVEVLKRLIEQMQQDQVITKAEGTRLQALVTLGEGLIALHDVKEAPTRLEKALELLKLGVKEAFTEGNVKVFLGNGADEAKKAAILIRLIK
jgi:hypothetical protein